MAGVAAGEHLRTLKKICRLQFGSEAHKDYNRVLLSSLLVMQRLKKLYLIPWSGIRK